MVSVCVCAFNMEIFSINILNTEQWQQQLVLFKYIYRDNFQMDVKSITYEMANDLV